MYKQEPNQQPGNAQKPAYAAPNGQFYRGNSCLMKAGGCGEYAFSALPGCLQRRLWLIIAHLQTKRTTMVQNYTGLGFIINPSAANGRSIVMERLGNLSDVPIATIIFTRGKPREMTLSGTQSCLGFAQGAFFSGRANVFPAPSATRRIWKEIVGVRITTLPLALSTRS